MDRRKLQRMVLSLLAALCGLGATPLGAPALPQEAQQASPQRGQQPVATVPGVIKSETNLVLVDAVATDKKGNYIRDLEAKDFKVYEDNKEQTISSFSRGTETGAPRGPAQRRYLVLFFDNSTMDLGDQARARQAAAQFIEKTASSDRLMAVADFGGTLHVAQNFTANTERLKQVVSGVKYSAVNPNEPADTTQVASLGAPTLSPMADFGARSMLLAVRTLAKNLQAVPGRKTVILFSSGFALTPERQSELTATVNACNRANVAIYPLDVRGLLATPPGASTLSPRVGLDEPSFPHDNALLAFLFTPAALLPQRPGGGGGGGAGGGGGGGRGGGGGGVGGGGGRGGGGGGGRGGSGGGTGGTGGGGTGGGRGGTGGGTGGTGGGKGGTGGGTGGTGGGHGGSTGGGGARGGGGGGPANVNRFGNNPLNQPRQIIPQIPESATTNQEVLYALAAGTGGFPIFNSNDLLAGMDKISKELDEYYVLGYVPPPKSAEGTCHTIKVRVERSGVNVRARSGYCDVRGSDLLAGKVEGKTLEAIAASPQAGSVPLSLRAPYFYAAPDVARVNLAAEIPGDAINFEKEKGEFHSDVNVLGIAYREDGSVGARFSDTVKLDVPKKEAKEYAKGTFPYQNTFEIAPGKYTLKVVLGAGGESYAKYEMPLVIEPYNGKQFQLSSVALSDKLTPVSELAASLDAALLDEKPPLVVKGSNNGQAMDFKVTPSPTNHFSRDDKVALYVEVYEPALLAKIDDTRVGIVYNVVDRKTNQQVYRSPTMLVNAFAQAGNPVIPVGTLLPLDKIQAGDYRLEVTARDSAGNASPVRTADFVLN